MNLAMKIKNVFSSYETLSRAKSIEEMDDLANKLEFAEYRIEQLRAALGVIADVYPYEVEQCSHIADQALREDDRLIN